MRDRRVDRPKLSATLEAGAFVDVAAAADREERST
jgi:hypothetical protein